MSQLVQIKYFSFLALKDDIDITEEMRKSFLLKTLNDFKGREVDIPTSLALISEFEKCPFQDKAFVNEVETPYSEITQDDDYVYVYPLYSVESERIPSLLKDAGMQLRRVQRIAYIVPSKKPDEPYALVDKNGAPFEGAEAPDSQRSGVTDPASLNISICDDVLALRKEDYKRFLRIQELIKSGKSHEVSDPDLYLWALVESFSSAREKTDVIFHEMKHIKNKLIMFDKSVDDEDYKISGTDSYKLQMDDELSAKLAEAIEAINTYNKSENKDDLSVFESSYILQQLLQGKNLQERKQMVLNIELLTKNVCDFWYKVYSEAYVPQFLHNTHVALAQTPLKHLVKTSDGKAYHEIRKLLFTYSVYNPKTGNYISMDLSKYIPEHVLDDKIIENIDNMYKENVVKREQNIQSRMDYVKQDLVDAAIQERKKLVENTAYRKKLKALREQGLSYSVALDYIPGMTIVEENMETIGEKVVKIQKAAEEKIEPKPQVESIPQTSSEPKKEKKAGFFRRAINKIDLFFFKRKKGQDTIDYE